MIARWASHDESLLQPPLPAYVFLTSPSTCRSLPTPPLPSHMCSNTCTPTCLHVSRMSTPRESFPVRPGPCKDRAPKPGVQRPPPAGASLPFNFSLSSLLHEPCLQSNLSTGKTLISKIRESGSGTGTGSHNAEAAAETSGAQGVNRSTWVLESNSTWRKAPTAQERFLSLWRFISLIAFLENLL